MILTGNEDLRVVKTISGIKRAFEELICEMDELEHLFEDLAKLLPEAFQIGKLREDGKTDGEIAEIIKIKRTTFRSQIDKAAKILAKKYPDHFNI